jgi:hypothetical protein
MSDSTKKSPSQSAAARRSKSTPPVFAPFVIGVPAEEFELTKDQVLELEKEGQIKLSEKCRTDLVTLGRFWIEDLLLRRSARPKQFYAILDKLEEVLVKAQLACQLNERPGSLERHLLHWAMAAPVPGALAFPTNVAALERQIEIVLETVSALKQCLPEDPGRQRPFDDERRIIYLADVFERAGGKAVAYASGYAKTGSMADTPFRRFAHKFYWLLPAEDKRDRGGLDDALRDALSTRRAQRRSSKKRGFCPPNST